MSDDKKTSFDPDSMYDKHIGSTLHPASIETTEVATKRVRFVDGSIITGVSQDYKSNSYTTIPSSYAVFQGLIKLQENLNSIDPHHNFFRDNTVVTLPLIDPHFLENRETEDIHWDILSWKVIDGQAVFSSVSNQDNYLRCPQMVFTFPGYYHLNVNVTRIDSGQLNIYDHRNRLISSIVRGGEHNFELLIAEPDLTTLRFKAEDVFTGHVIIIESINLHLVTDRFRDYLTGHLARLGVGEGALSEERVRELALDEANKVGSVINLVINELKDSQTRHTASVGNIHNATPDDLGCAAAQHTHTEFGSIDGDLSNALAHADIKSGNPHGSTAIDVGAAPVSHTHTPSQCGAAPEVHDHDNKYLGSDAFDNIEAMIKGMIDGAVGQNVSSNFTSTYPFLISRVDDIGDLPPWGDPSTLTYPATVLLFPYLLHMAEDNYDFLTGAATCNRTLYNNCSAAKGFSDYFGLAALFDDTTVIAPTILTYKFHATREISGYKIYKSPDAQAEGFVTSWTLSVDGTVVDTNTNTTWADFFVNKTRSTDRMLAAPVSGKEFTLTVLSTATQASKKWGVRISFIYSDAVSLNANPAMLNTPLSVNFLNFPASNIVEKMVLSVDPLPAIDTSLYLFFRKERRPDDTGNLRIVYQLQLELIPLEFSQVQLGRAVMLDVYKDGNSHPTWGTITVNNQNMAHHQIQNVYSTDPTKYYQSTVSTLITIIHKFPTAMSVSGIVGFELHWSSQQVIDNQVPKSYRITITGTYIDSNSNSVAGSSEVVTVSDYQYPVHDADVKGLKAIHRFARNKQMSDVSEVRIDFNYAGSRPGQILVALQQLVIGMRGWWYNPYSQETSNADRLPFGVIDRVTLPSTSLLPSALRHVQYALSKVMVVPVNNYDRLEAGSYIVRNPHSTLEVIVSVVELVRDIQHPGPEGERLQALAVTADEMFIVATVGIRILAFTEDNIYVEVDIPGRYGLKVSRQW